MKNKIELKKMCITSCIVIIIFLITFSILIYKQYKTYTYNFNQKIAGIIDNILEKYPDIVTVYNIGDVSRELCGGPHVKNTSELGHFRIVKEEASSAGVRRIKAVLE